MKNILIDTCSWINLLSEDSNKLLPHLEFWKSNNYIRIISHEKIIEEWNLHKKEQERRLSNSLNTKYRHTKDIAKKEGLLVPEALSPNFDEIVNQIKLIDDLLLSSHVLETPNDIKVFCADWQIMKKAPFHNKIDSMKDAYIIFTTLKHFTEVGKEFIFISDNKKDFGSIDNPDTKIHPQIIENYPKVSLHYFKDIGRAINTLKQELPISLLPKSINTTNINNIEDEIIIDKTRPILNQVYDYVSIRHKEIKFYPISLFINHYPLKENSYNYYSTFNLDTDNEALFELFKSVEVSENNEISINNAKFYNKVENYKAKIKAVLLGFSGNLIFNISSNKSREYLPIKYSEKKICRCPKCCFQKFKFTECFENLNTYTNSKEDLQESSYLNYQIGNYLFAIEKQKSALAKYKKEHLNISYFIGLFNLSKLSIFVNNNFYAKNSKDKLIKELKAIDLEYEEINLSSKENKKLIKYLRENTFYNEASAKIQEISSKLIDQYYSSLSGGWSLNSNVWVLINEFAKLEAFLVRNLIVYDQFKQFQDVFSIFIEGIFASHATKPSHRSRLKSFDDWLISKIIQYGNSDTINKYYIRYKLKKIHYEKTSSNESSFEDLVNNFFSNKNLKESLSENCENKNDRFWDYYDNIFKNLIILVSICDFDKTLIYSFSKQLVSHLESETYIHRHSFEYINTYLYRCGEYLDQKLIYRLFDLGINKQVFHNSRFYNSLLQTIKKKATQIIITTQQFKTIKNIAFEECSLCKEIHLNTIIIPLYFMIENSDFKKELVNMIKRKLQENFSFDLFYQATLFELIPLDNDMLSKAIETSLPKSNQLSFRSFFSGINDTRFDQVNAILNLCFKFNIDTTIEKFLPFKALGSYYSWLIDMDNFNYDLFETEWIGEYTTRYFYRKIHSNRFVKEKLDGIIKDNFDSNLGQEYLNIYVRKTWDVQE